MCIRDSRHPAVPLLEENSIFGRGARRLRNAVDSAHRADLLSVWMHILYTYR